MLFEEDRMQRIRFMERTRKDYCTDYKRQCDQSET